MAETPIAIATMNNSTIFASFGITSVTNSSTGTYRTNFNTATQTYRTSTHDAAIICQAQNPSTSNFTYRILHKYEYHYSVQSYAQLGYRRVTNSAFGVFIAPGYHSVVVTTNQTDILSDMFVLAAGRLAGGTLSSASHGITSVTNVITGAYTITFASAVTSNFATPQTQMPIFFQHYIGGGFNTVDLCYARTSTSITIRSITNGGTSTINTNGSIIVFNL
jgi:hypothetical protein